MDGLEQDEALLLGERDEGDGLGGGVRDGLLEQDVLARVQRLHGPLVVQHVRKLRRLWSTHASPTSTPRIHTGL